METVQINVYPLDELHGLAKERAVDHYRDNFLSFDYMYQEVTNTLEAFHAIFPTKQSHRTRFGFLSCWEQGVDELRGLRLRKWLINNFHGDLYKGKYYGKLSDTDKYGEPIKTDKKHPAGLRHIKRYSRAMFNNSCVLTGVCYDDSLLKPMYDFIEYAEPNRGMFAEMDLADLIGACLDSLRKDFESEMDTMNGDAYIEEQAVENGLRYLGDGTFFSAQ